MTEIEIAEARGYFNGLRRAVELTGGVDDEQKMACYRASLLSEMKATDRRLPADASVDWQRSA